MLYVHGLTQMAFFKESFDPGVLTWGDGAQKAVDGGGFAFPFAHFFIRSRHNDTNFTFSLSNSFPSCRPSTSPTIDKLHPKDKGILLQP